MNAKTLCLGVLSLCDASGYEIKKRFGESFSHFFVAGYGSIYPALEQLKNEGMVRCSEMEQEKRPDKKVYSITKKGRKFFRDELAGAYPAHKVRSLFLVLMFFSHLIPPEKLAEKLDTRLADIEKQLECIKSHEKDMDKFTPGMVFTMRFGMAVLGASRDFIRDNKGSLLEQVREKK